MLAPASTTTTASTSVIRKFGGFQSASLLMPTSKTTATPMGESSSSRIMEPAALLALDEELPDLNERPDPSPERPSPIPEELISVPGCKERLGLEGCNPTPSVGLINPPEERLQPIVEERASFKQSTVQNSSGEIINITDDDIKDSSMK